MNCLKKFLLATLALFLTIKFSVTEPRKLKVKVNRTRKEVAQAFKTDDQQELAQEVKNINVQTPQDRQVAKIELQNEVAQEKTEIRADLIKAQQSQSDYISYDQALEIITSKKELSMVKQSSWTRSAIVKPLTQTYRLFLRVWNPKEYTSLLEKERKALEHELNVQAYNNFKLLYVALDLELKKTDLNIEHMFKKNSFYNIATHAFEGGGILAEDILIYEPLEKLFSSLNDLIENNFSVLKNNPLIVQSIWDANQIIEEAKTLRESNIRKELRNDKKNIRNTAPENQKSTEKELTLLASFVLFLRSLTIWYSPETIKKLCIEAAQENGQVLLDNKKSYSQYLKDWISEPKNAATAGLVMAAIGGLYLYGPAAPQWLKDYTNSSVSLIKENLSQGYQTTISSMKNLWNKVRGNTELPDSNEAKMDAQEQESEIDQYFLEKGNTDALSIEQEKALKTQQAEAFLTDEFDQQHNEHQHEEGWSVPIQSTKEKEPEFANTEYKLQGGISANPTSGQISKNAQITEVDLEKLKEDLDDVTQEIAKTERILENPRKYRAKIISSQTNLKETIHDAQVQINKAKEFMKPEEAEPIVKSLEKIVTTSNQDISELEGFLKNSQERTAKLEASLAKLKETALDIQSFIIEEEISRNEQNR